MADCWAIGNRFIMTHYCKYYLYISCNMVDGIFCSAKKWKLFKATNIQEYRNNNNIQDDASDSGEFGLTYVVKHKNKYNLDYSLGDKVIAFKFYDDFLFNYFKNH